MMRTGLRVALCLTGFLALAAAVAAQADYPFRDPNLADDQRIADLLGRLTLDEKVDLMSNHPKIPRLGIVFSGQVEGLHGLALGGPGGWGPRGKQPLPTTTFPQEKGLGDDVGPGTAQEDRRARRATRPATTTRIPSPILAASWSARPTPT